MPIANLVENTAVASFQPMSDQNFNGQQFEISNDNSPLVNLDDFDFDKLLE